MTRTVKSSMFACRFPHAALYLENGRHTNMRALAKNQARVLVFVSATCAGCVKF